MTLPKIFIGMPCYTDMGANPVAVKMAILGCGLQGKAQYAFEPVASSLLASGFNMLWATAINNGCDYFCMLHADIVPQENWAAILLEDLQKHQADVVSACSPIKNNQGLFSCGIGDPKNRWAPLFRFTAKQLQGFPEVFSAEEAGWPGYPLVVNTGCFIADLRKPWVREKGSDGSLKVHFEINNRLMVSEDGKLSDQSEPEDWHFSRLLHEAGAKVLATRRVALAHLGTYAWKSNVVWGNECDHLALRKEVEELKIDPHGFWLDEDGPGHHYDKNLADAIVELIDEDASLPAPPEVLDAGCGLGKYVARFMERGLLANGVDGNPHTEAIPYCSVGDLADPDLALDLADWVVSLEVGEHIPEEHEATYLKHLADCADRGIVLSWAVPGQPGRGHVNCRKNVYVIGKMTELGFWYDPKETAVLRAVARLPYFRETLMVFRRCEHGA